MQPGGGPEYTFYSSGLRGGAGDGHPTVGRTPEARNPAVKALLRGPRIRPAVDVLLAGDYGKAEGIPDKGVRGSVEMDLGSGFGRMSERNAHLEHHFLGRGAAQAEGDCVGFAGRFAADYGASQFGNSSGFQAVEEVLFPVGSGQLAVDPQPCGQLRKIG